MEEDKRPHYILIVGGPDQIPFGFQSILNTTAMVGRISFDSKNPIEDLSTYIEKVISLENAKKPIVNKRAIFFAPDGGWTPFKKRDPTYYSRLYMAEPLAKEVNNVLNFNTIRIMGTDATKDKLLKSFESKPALVYTASHGMADLGKDLKRQKRINGAICCQKTGNNNNEEDYLFRADDIPLDKNKPFLEGAVVFQFACFGYGTPKESYFNHWLMEEPRLHAESDFIAALPQRLLSHPRGPIGFIGHVDLAFIHGFDDPQNKNIPSILGKPWHDRIGPFRRAVKNLLEVDPTGIAMEDMRGRQNVMDGILVDTYDLLQRGYIEETGKKMSDLINNFIIRNDATYYMIFGDPAVHLRIP